jgi:preprotein translocase subunit SecD
MNKRNLIVVTLILITFVLAMLVLFPIDKGLLGGRDILLGLDLQGGLHLVYKADLSSVEAGTEADIIKGVIAVIMNRINPLGVTEPVVNPLGEDRIVVELPGESISDVQKERLGRTALLGFREYVGNEEGEGEWIPATGTINGEEKALTSSYFKENTYVTRDDYGNIYLVFEWNEEGSQLSEQITTRLLGKQLAIYEGDEPLIGDDGYPIAPKINSVITDSGQIEGLSINEATDLSSQLNAGRLPVSLEIVYEQNTSPKLGADFVDLSVIAGLIGILLVLLFMVLYYRIPGFVASLALIFYGTLMLALFKLVQVTLTLPGIGGFVLSIGMAVDANILIFERMKEELQKGRTLGAAIEAGFSRAWTAIRDSNVTTFIVCIILYWVGNSVVGGESVKGFALTLFIGVALSMFTAIVVTKTFLRLFIGTRIARRSSLFSPYLGRKDV